MLDKSGIYGAVGHLPGLAVSNDSLTSEQGRDRSGYLFEQDATQGLPEQGVILDSPEEVLALHGTVLNAPNARWSTCKKSRSWLGESVRTTQRFDELEGPVQGFHYEKNLGRLLLHVDFARQHPIYFYVGDGGLIFAHSLQRMVKLMRRCKIAVEPNEAGAAMLISFGALLGEETLILGVRKLLPGHSLLWERNKIDAQPRTNLIDIKPTLINLNDASDRLDDAFGQGVEWMSETNRQLNFVQRNLLSGGIDSRMVLFATAKRVDKIETACFSSKGYLDESISASIAQSIRSSHHFCDLRNGEYMMNTASAFEYDGTINYLASAHHRYALSHLAWSNGGVIGSGQLGNEILCEFHQPPRFSSSRVSNLLLYPGAYSLCQENAEKVWHAIDDPTIFKLYNRGFLSTNSAAYSTRPHGVLWSPFTSRRFVTTALQLSPNMRRNHRAYLGWMQRYYPEASNFSWERYGARPKAGVALNVAKTWSHVRCRLPKTFRVHPSKSMSPIEWWYDQSETLQIFFADSFHDNEEQLNLYPNLKPILQRDYEGMSVQNKSSVLTLLLTSKLFFTP